MNRHVLACVAALALSSGALAQGSAVHVPAQSLAQSLRQVAQQTGTSILFTPEAVRGLRASAVEGSMSAQEAVERLIAGTDLRVELDSDGTLIVHQRYTEEPRPSAPVDMKEPAARETVVVTGIRASLQRSLDIKKSALGLVDAVSMEDIGKFPDSNLATAAMRIPGVTVNRGVTNMSGIDTTTGEPTQITIRGFGPSFNEVLSEDRRIPSAVGNRSFDFSALNSDLVQWIEVLKSPSSDLSAGAIGATVNIKYPLPFDHPGLLLTASASTTVSPEEGKFTPNGSFLFSNTFAGDRFGIAVSGAYAETKNRSNEATIWGWEGTYLDPCQFQGGPVCAGALNADTTKPVWFIQDYGIYQIHNWQMREEVRAVAQWKPTDAVQLTADGTFSRSDLKQFQYSFAIWNNANEMQNVVANDNGTITSFVRGNAPTDFNSAVNEQVLQSYEVGANLKWTIGRLTVVADAATALASLSPGGQYTNMNVDVGYGPSTPHGTNGTDVGIVVPAEAGHGLPLYTSLGPGGDASRFLDSSIIGSHVMVLISQRNRNSVTQSRLEGRWSGEGVEITAGAHFVADHMRTTSFNNFASNQWQAFAGYGPDSNNYYDWPANNRPAGVHLPSSLFSQTFSTKDFVPGWKGSAGLPPFIFKFSAAEVLAHLESLGDPAQTAIPGFNEGCCKPDYSGRFDVVSSDPSYQRVFEDTYAGYLAVTDEAVIGGMPLKVHSGVRVEHTVLSSSGIGYRLTSLSVMPSDHTAFLVMGDDPRMITEHRGYLYVLPNIDLSLQVTDELKIRFDASRTLARPPLGYLSPVRNRLKSERVGALSADSGNPDLRPYTSDNVDLSADWYYAPNSYFSLDGYLKSVDNLVVSSTTTQTIDDVIDPTTGQLAQFRVTAPVNGPTANVFGLELAWQHVFGDSGFGIQATATVVETDKPYDPYDISTSNFAVAGLADSANLLAFYDKDGFEARIAVNWRDSYLDRFGQYQNNSAFGAEPVFVDASWSLDFGARYEIDERITAYFEAMNLLDATFCTRGRFPEQVLDVVAYGRRLTVGVHYEL